MISDLGKEATNQLVRRMKDGDSAAFKFFFNTWKDRIYNFALRYSNDSYFAHEVMQKTFIQAYEKIHQLNDHSKLKSWLYRIASNNCFSEGRRVSRTTYVEVNEANSTVDHQYTPSGRFEKNEIKDLVNETLQMIPEDQRKVIIMKEYEGLKFREIAELLGESENTIKSRMYYGLDAMRKVLVQKNLTKEMYL